MSDVQTPPPSAQDKIIAALATLADEMRQSKIQMQDIHAQRVEYAKDIRDLKASVDTTRRALDPEELAKHVAENNTAFIGEHLGHLATIAKLGHNTANETKAALANLKDTTGDIKATKQQLSAVANRLEERDARSKWDWVMLVAGRAVAALLAGGGASYAAKATIEAKDFDRAVTSINQGKDDYWCKQAGSRPFQDNANNWFCPISMQGYQPED